MRVWRSRWVVLKHRLLSFQTSPSTTRHHMIFVSMWPQSKTAILSISSPPPFLWAIYLSAMSMFSLLSFWICFWDDLEKYLPESMHSLVLSGGYLDINQESCCLCYIIIRDWLNIAIKHVTQNGMQIAHCFNCFGDKRLYQKQYEHKEFSVLQEHRSKPIYLCWLIWMRTCIINMNESTCINICKLPFIISRLRKEKHEPTVK